MIGINRRLTHRRSDFGRGGLNRLKSGRAYFRLRMAIDFFSGLRCGVGGSPPYVVRT